jgi:hypothetical protein
MIAHQSELMHLTVGDPGVASLCPLSPPLLTVGKAAARGFRLSELSV